MLRGILTVGGWTMASRLLGFLRDILIAALAGAGPVADAFFVANRLPNLFRRLFGEGAFNAAFVPAFSSLLHREGADSAKTFAQETIAVMAFWLLALTLLCMVAMPVIMLGFAPGFADEKEKFALTVELARIAFPYMPLICLTALLSGILNGLDRFAAAAAAPVLYNLVSIACMLWLVPFVPSVGHALAWGVSASGIVQLALLYFAVRRAGMRLHLPRPRLTPRIRALLRKMGPGVLGAGITQVNMSVDVIIATLLPAGTAAILYYADRVAQLPLGVIGVAVGTALLPRLSRAVAAAEQGGDANAPNATLNQAISYALVLTLPAAIALIAVGAPIIDVLFRRGAFTAETVIPTAQALAAYAAGLPAFVLLKILAPAFFARGDTSTPVRVGLWCIALNLTLNVALMHPLQHMGPPLASSLSNWANVIALAAILLHRGHMALTRPLMLDIARMAAAALLMAVALWALQRHAYAPFAAHPTLRWLGLALLVGGGMATYALAATALGILNPAQLLARLRRRKG
jgi:putative peptidoglycan lipid II flippase